MQQEITCIRICNYCDELIEYNVRSGNINSNLTDRDIQYIIAKSIKEPSKLMHCDECELETVQTIVAWKGITDKED